MAKIAWDKAPSTGNPEVDQFLQDMLEIAKSVQLKGNDVQSLAGAGAPEGVITANVGSTYRQTDGGTLTSFWVKESGTGNTGWASK